MKIAIRSSQNTLSVIACIALEVFDGRDGSQLLYAAQVAMSTLKAKGAKKK